MDSVGEGIGLGECQLLEIKSFKDIGNEQRNPFVPWYDDDNIILF